MVTYNRYPQHPDITTEMWEKIDGAIERGKGKPGSLITVLRECQDVALYLPSELLSYISLGLDLSLSQVFGVVTFYSFFSLIPKGRHNIKVCTGTACYVKGIQEATGRIRAKYGLEAGKTTADRRFFLEEVRCLGACGLAPVMVVDNDIFGALSPEKAVDILDKYQ